MGPRQFLGRAVGLGSSVNLEAAGLLVSIDTPDGEAYLQRWIANINAASVMKGSA